MTRNRNPTTGEIWTEDELMASLAEQIATLDEESYVRQDVKLRGGRSDPRVHRRMLPCWPRREH